VTPSSVIVYIFMGSYDVCWPEGIFVSTIYLKVQIEFVTEKNYTGGFQQV